MRISDWSSDVCSSDLLVRDECAAQCEFQVMPIIGAKAPNYMTGECIVGLARHKQYGAARGVAAEQRALRSLEHLHVLQVEELLSEIGNVREIGDDARRVLEIGRAHV